MANLVTLEVETISTETIKPSTPTPPHLTTHPISRLDQLMSWLEYSTPLISFYPSSSSSSTTDSLLHRLKSSLATTLTLFYPLAGRLSTDLTTLLCNDAGVPLTIARTQTPLSTFLTSSNRTHFLPLFLPTTQTLLINHPGSEWVLFAVQLTLFHCGAIAIGSHILHNASLDGISWAHLLQTWAAFASGRFNDVVPPDFETALSLFPPCREFVPQPMAISEPIVLGPTPTSSVIDEDGGYCVVKPFGFSKSSIAGLQAMCRSEQVPHPTRIEAVSAFLWMHLMAVAFHTSNSSETERKKRSESVLIHSVNMRPLLRPPQPSQVFGKFTTHAITHCSDVRNETIPDIVELATMIRKSILKAKDIKWISKFLGEGGEEEAYKHGQQLNQMYQDPNLNTYFFVSWSGLDMDFGLGKPIWNGFMGGKVKRYFRNFIPFIHAPNYDGIEAWLILDEQEMTLLESNPQFLAFASHTFGSMMSLPRSLL